MASKYLIATRLTFSEMATALNVPSIPRLNQSMASILRKVAISQGIKASQAGKRLEFYVVNPEQFNELTNPVMATMVALRTSLAFLPLLAVDDDKLSAAIKSVNSRPEYMRGMTYAVKCQYDKDLQAAVSSAVMKINEDAKVERKKGYNTSGLKVGDIIDVPIGYRSTSNAIITKITESSYTYRAWIPLYSLEKNSDMCTKNGGSRASDDWVGDATLPIKGNEILFKMGKATTKRWGKPGRWQQEAITEGGYGYGMARESWDHLD